MEGAVQRIGSVPPINRPDGRLYVAGTFRHGGQLDVAERYDPVAGKWEDLPPMSMLVQFSAGAWVF